MITNLKFRLVLLTILVMTVVSGAVSFGIFGISIYGERFFFFAAITAFISFVLVKIIVEQMFYMIDAMSEDASAS